MRNIPPLASVRVFEAAARHLNFTSAAAELGMTQAAVSYQVKLLEERLGVALFTRVAKRVALTEEGQAVAPLVSSAFDTLDSAFAVARAGESVLRVTAITSFATAWLAPRLGRFQLANPDIAFQLDTGKEVHDFGATGFDVGIRIGRDPGEWPGMVAHFLHRVFFTPMCSPGLTGIDTPEQLRAVTRLGSDDRWWELWFAAAGVPYDPGETPPTRLDAQNLEAQIVMAGQAATLLTPLLWTNELASGRLVRPFDTVAFDGKSLWLVYPEPKRNLPRIRKFRDWMLEEFATEAEGDATGAFVPPSP